MNRRVGSVLVRVLFVTLLITVGFALLHEPVRALEMRVAAEVLAAMGAEEQLRLLGTSIAVFPREGPFFVAVLTPSCSALASVLAMCSLGVLLPKAPTSRRMVAVAAACAAIVVGNFLRILLSLTAGLVAGRVSLVLFHDVAGSVFTFAYVLGGYILMLTLLLPRGASAAARPEGVVAHAAA